jgi:hypothetical protein
MNNPHLYRVFVYFRGRDKAPSIEAQTGCQKNAIRTAEDFATEGYPATVLNTETLERTQFSPKPKWGTA